MHRGRKVGPSCPRCIIQYFHKPTQYTFYYDCRGVRAKCVLSVPCRKIRTFRPRAEKTNFPRRCAEKLLFSLCDLTTTISSTISSNSLIKFLSTTYFEGIPSRLIGKQKARQLIPNSNLIFNL